VRGALTMAGVMTLPLTLADGSPFPGRQLAILLASAVIVVSLLLASVALPRLLRNIQLNTGPGTDAHAAREAEREYRLTALRAERDTILRLGRRREISDETARKLLQEIDLVEARYRES
jgi:CPA1 family monovalent cation:H+ antiporter